MTKQDAIDALLKGSLNTNSHFVTITREHLLIALGALPETDTEESNDDTVNDSE
jgi:hypothetical protein